LQDKIRIMIEQCADFVQKAITCIGLKIER
jgi:hypothetical protein